jgi:hypothetical protein
MAKSRTHNNNSKCILNTLQKPHQIFGNEIKNRLNLENAWYHSVQYIFLCCCLSKDIKIK